MDSGHSEQFAENTDASYFSLQSLPLISPYSGQYQEPFSIPVHQADAFQSEIMDLDSGEIFLACPKILQNNMPDIGSFRAYNGVRDQVDIGSWKTAEQSNRVSLAHPAPSGACEFHPLPDGSYLRDEVKDAPPAFSRNNSELGNEKSSEEVNAEDMMPEENFIPIDIPQVKQTVGIASEDIWDEISDLALKQADEVQSEVMDLDSGEIFLACPKILQNNMPDIGSFCAYNGVRDQVDIGSWKAAEQSNRVSLAHPAPSGASEFHPLLDGSYLRDEVKDAPPAFSRNNSELGNEKSSEEVNAEDMMPEENFIPIDIPQVKQTVGIASEDIWDEISDLALKQADEVQSEVMDLDSGEIFFACPEILQNNMPDIGSFCAYNGVRDQVDIGSWKAAEQSNRVSLAHPAPSGASEFHPLPDGSYLRDEVKDAPPAFSRNNSELGNEKSSEEVNAEDMMPEENFIPIDIPQVKQTVGIASEDIWDEISDLALKQADEVQSEVMDLDSGEIFFACPEILQNNMPDIGRFRAYSGVRDQVEIGSWKAAEQSNRVSLAHPAPSGASEFHPLPDGSYLRDEVKDAPPAFSRNNSELGNEKSSEEVNAEDMMPEENFVPIDVPQVKQTVGIASEDIWDEISDLALKQADEVQSEVMDLDSGEIFFACPEILQNNMPDIGRFRAYSGVRDQVEIGSWKAAEHGNRVSLAQPAPSGASEFYPLPDGSYLRDEIKDAPAFSRNNSELGNEKSSEEVNAEDMMPEENFIPIDIPQVKQTVGIASEDIWDEISDLALKQADEVQSEVMDLDSGAIFFACPEILQNNMPDIGRFRAYSGVRDQVEIGSWKAAEHGNRVSLAQPAPSGASEIYPLPDGGILNLRDEIEDAPPAFSRNNSELGNEKSSEEVNAEDMMPEENFIPIDIPQVKQAVSIASEDIWDEISDLVLKVNPDEEIEKEDSSTGPVTPSTDIIETMPFNCHPCQMTFETGCYLKQHNNAKHNGSKLHRCGVCGKKFECVDSYQKHVGKHGVDKPYKCEVCPKRYNHKIDLSRHTATHGQMPHVCIFCGKGFVRKDHMKKHVTRVHKDSV